MGFDFTLLASGPFELPDGWRVARLSDVVIINELGIQSDYEHEWIEYIDIASVEKGTIREIQHIRLEEAPSRARRIVSDADTLISTVRPNLEHYVFVKKAKPNLIASTGFAVVTAKQADSRFIYYYLTTRPFTEYLTRIADSHTSAYPSFNPDVIEKAELLLPPYDEQRAIAHILGSLDDKIELNRRMNETLEAMARAIFKSWFVDFAPVRAKAEGRDPGLPKEIADLFPDKFEDSEIGEIPKGWRVEPLSEFTTVITKGTTPTQDEIESAPEGDTQINYVRVNAIEDDGAILFDKLTAIPESVHLGVLKRSILRANDVLYTIAGTIGRISIVEESLLPANTNQAVAILRPKPTIPVNFLVLTMRQAAFREELHSNIVHAVQANLSLGMLSRARVTVLPKNMLLQLFKPIDDLVKLIGANRTESRTLAAIRDALLPKLISGELRVPDAEKFIEEADV